MSDFPLCQGKIFLIFFGIKKGASAVEYGIMVAAIAAVIIATVFISRRTSEQRFRHPLKRDDRRRRRCRARQPRAGRIFRRLPVRPSSIQRSP